MSADNVIYVLETPDGKGGFEYRVGYAFASDFFELYPDEMESPDFTAILVPTFKGSQVFSGEHEAFDEARKQEHEIGYVEYGILFMDLERPFNSYLEGYNTLKDTKSVSRCTDCEKDVEHSVLDSYCPDCGLFF